MDYLLAAQSLAYFGTALCWAMAWKEPTQRFISTAAFVTALSFALNGFRLAVGIMLSAA
jgi:hypothetical protein